MKNLAQALSKMQGQMTPAIKDATNPAFKSKYADLASVWEAIRKPLSDNGLSVTQQTDILDNGQMLLVTTLWHVSGESLVARYPLMPAQNTIQAVGSCLSYARRYSLSALLGVTQDDDDGNAASNRITSGNTAPPPPDRNAAAKGYVSDAIRALGQLTTADELDAWLAENAAKLTRLKSAFPEGYDTIDGAMNETRNSLTTARRSAAE